jgi:hypothetical protein
MEISYIRGQTKETIHISEGVIIVPPQVLHKIKLHGITFVFQASIKGGKVHDDKKVKAFKF